MFPPRFVPLSFHWKEGAVPPFVGTAVKVTKVPAQTGFCDAEIVTLTGCGELTVIVTALEVAGLPDGQETFDVNTQVTICPLVKVDVVNVDELVPAFTLFTFH